MVSDARYRINSPKVISQTVDGETIIINLDSGAYYTLNESGTCIWLLIEAGLPTSNVIKSLTNRYRGSLNEIQVTVLAFVERLLREGLLIAADATDGSPVEWLPEVRVNAKETAALPSPVMTKYTDMKDLLLLDPIHEVGETGWPVKKPAEGFQQDGEGR